MYSNSNERGKETKPGAKRHHGKPTLVHTHILLLIHQVNVIVKQNEVFCDSKMNQGFSSDLFLTNAPKSAAYAQEERPMSDAANLDKGYQGCRVGWLCVRGAI